MGHLDNITARYQWVVIFFAAAIYLGCIVSPPALMDDVDAVQATIARNMLESGDWVTARLDGIAYLEKSPAIYWSMAASYFVFGVRDWAARIPLALSVVFLCWLTARFAAWAFNRDAGLYAGLVLASSVGLWLFTRIQIPDAMLTATITVAMWAFLRLQEGERGPLWTALFGISMGLGLLLKGLIALLFPAGAILLYFAVRGELLDLTAWKRLRPGITLLLILLVAAPWHILAALRNPPLLDFTMSSGPGNYHGFFWFYFFNEHVFRFLNMRYPRDYNTVPRALFWLFHLLWLFPFSAFFPGVARLRFRAQDRASRTRLLALCWTGFLLLFFTLSTTQEYYSMPCYPALALLLACSLQAGDGWGRRILLPILAAASIACCAILIRVYGLPTRGDISSALTQNPDAYTLSLGHMGDLTMDAFAYLRTPLAIAAVAFAIGAFGAWRFRGRSLALSIAVMMTFFFHAARAALVVFDPYLGSRALAEAYRAGPPGQMILDDQYYAYSSVLFYGDLTNGPKVLLLNGRVNNLEYGSNAPGAPRVFIDDAEFVRRWRSPQRCYVVFDKPALPRFERLLGQQSMQLVLASGGKFLLRNL